MSQESAPIPISAIQHGVYCLRQAALIHVERLWEENRFTAEGRVTHERADMRGERAGRGVRRLSALALASTAFGVAGVADLVEMRAGPEGERPYPVEFKRGKPKPHRADEAQLCALALINRGQLRAGDFETREGGATLLTDEARKRVLAAWQERKKDERTHPFLEEKAAIGLFPYLQAQMLARCLRGDLDAYPPLLWS